MAVASLFMRLERVLLWYVLVSAVVVLVNCGRGGPEPQLVDAQVLAQKVTILPQSETASALSPCSRRSASGVTSTWLPAMSDVVSAESRLKGYLNSRLDRDLDNYYRQYVGIVIDGKRVLLIHAFQLPMVDERIEEVAPKWRTEYVSVCHGGKVSWGIEYYVESHKFVNFETNSGPDHVR
jgi:hypothetical protein